MGGSVGSHRGFVLELGVTRVCRNSDLPSSVVSVMSVSASGCLWVGVVVAVASAAVPALLSRVSLVVSPLVWAAYYSSSAVAVVLSTVSVRFVWI